MIIAGAANLFVATIKLAAGILAGSSAMLAEAAHSVADTLNQGFLLASVHRAERPADRKHPFGYGQERYFWSLLAAFGIFIAGGGFSIFEGILALGRSGNHGGVLIAYVALGLSGLAEGTSLIRATWQTRAQAKARHIGLIEHIRTSSDTTLKAAFFEDSVAIVGLVLAFAGLALRELTGSEVWDAASSMAIGAMLIIVAIRLGADNRDLLIGQAADADQLRLIRREIAATPGIAALLELLTMHLGPDCIIVAARVAFDDDISADQVENLSDAIDARLAKRLSVAAHVFLDPTQLTSEAAAAAPGAPGAVAAGTVAAGDLAADTAPTD